MLLRSRSFLSFFFPSRRVCPPSLFLCPLFRPSLPPGRRSCLVLSSRWSSCLCCVSFSALVGVLGSFSPFLRLLPPWLMHFDSCPAPARCLPVLLFNRILSLSASPSVLSFWMFLVSSFVFVLVPVVPDFLHLAFSLAFSCGGVGETAPGFSPSRLPAVVSLRGAHRPCFQRSGLFLRAPLPEGRGSFSFSPGNALPLAIGMWHLTCPPFRVRLRVSI